MRVARGIVLTEIGLVLTLAGATALLGLTLGLALVVVLGLGGLVLYMPAKDGRKTTACMCAAGFFSATMTKTGGTLQIADMMIGLAAAMLLFGRDGPRRTPRLNGTSRWLLLGMMLISLGGFLGGVFQPAHNPFVVTAGYKGSRLGPISIRFADDVRFTLFTSGLILLIAIWRPERRVVRSVLFSYGAGVVVSVVYGFLHGGTAQGRQIGTTVQPVFYGLICAFGFMVALGLLGSTKGRGRWFVLLVVLAGGVGILTSGTRGAIGVVGAAILILEFGQRSIRSTLALIGTTVMGLFIFLVAPGRLNSLPLINRLNGGGYSELSVRQRGVFRHDAIQLIKHQGITGAGFRYLVPPHNFILGFVDAAGILGLIGLIIIVGALLVRFVHTPSDDALSLAVLATSLAVFVNSWVLNAFWDRWLWLPIFLIAALPERTEQPQQAESPSPHAPAAVPAGSSRVHALSPRPERAN